jgi:hypothetical protein
MGWSGRAPAPSAIETGKGRLDKEHAMSQQLTTTVAVVGIDIGKNSFHVVGLDVRGALALRQKWSRGQVEARLANMPPCLIGMEARRCAPYRRHTERYRSRTLFLSSRVRRVAPREAACRRER